MKPIRQDITNKIRNDIFGTSFTHMYIHGKIMLGIEQKEGMRHRLIFNRDRWFDIHNTIKQTHRNDTN